MEKKDMYTLGELFDNLKISLSKLGKMADINEGTLIRIRKGQYSVRRITINKLLDAFSEVYGLHFSVENVTGFTLEDKKSHTAVTEQEPVQPVSTRPYDDSSQKQEPQILNVEPSEGDMLLNDFAKMSDIPIRTLCNWKDASPPKIEVTSHKRPHGGGTEYFISPEEQEKAIELRKRYPGKRK